MRPSEAHPQSLESLHGDIWNRLSQTTSDLSHPWRTPTLATAGPDHPDARIVVLREVDLHERTLVCFSDSRAHKVAGVRIQPVATWCFYDPVSRIQLRARGETQVHIQDSITRHHWEKLPHSSRRLYGTVPRPGEQILAPCEIAFGDYPVEQFTVLVTTVHELDWLQLKPEYHERARFRWDTDSWEAHWACP
jgi:pyridoxine/pyridoxamine 5'-phosphate oxidase